LDQGRHRRWKATSSSLNTMMSAVPVELVLERVS
jgi:hypothetical protein